MSEINPTAFPYPNPNYDGNWDKNPHRGGMTLRDWFAGQAVSGWLASYGEDQTARATDVAKFAYEVADAMLAARPSKEGGE